VAYIFVVSVCEEIHLLPILNRLFESSPSQMMARTLC
jgi:hypothetical protein